MNLDRFLDIKPLAREENLEVVAPQRPSLDESVVHLDSRTKRLVCVLRSSDLRQKHSLERAKLGRHLLGEVLEVGRLDDLQTLSASKVNICRTCEKIEGGAGC